MGEIINIRPAQIPEEENKMLDFIDLKTILKYCIIAKSYKVANKVVEPIELSPAGELLRSQLRDRVRTIPPNEAKLAVSLAVAVGDEVFVNFDDTNINELRHALSEEVQAKKIMFPDVYRKETAGELFQDHEFSSKISNETTVALLKRTETGVFQVGRSVIGPWGCRYSQEQRLLAPTYDVPGFYCEREECDAIHPFRIDTARKAKINVALEELGVILEGRIPKHPSLRARQFEISSAKRWNTDPFVDSFTLMNFLGDSLTHSERVKVAEVVLRKALKEEQTAREKLSSISGKEIQNPADFVTSLTDSELMQFFHLHSDVRLIHSIDESISKGIVRIQEGTTRFSRIERWQKRRTRAEISSYGLRFKVPANREHVFVGHALQEIYEGDPEELAYCLSEDGFGYSLDDLISKVYQSKEIETVVDNCLLHNRSTMKKLCNILHIDNEPNGKLLTRDEITRILKWKMGVSNEAKFEDLHSLISSINNFREDLSKRSEADKLRELSVIFSKLETELLRSLKFTRWSLSGDHFSERPKFTYFHNKIPDAHHILIGPDGVSQGDRPTLATLGNAFNRLASELEDSDSSSRDELELPIGTIISHRPFAFASRLIYRDLTTSSQEKILENLRKLTIIFTDPEFLNVRNSGAAHGNVRFPTDEEIAQALDSAFLGLKIIADMGFSPIIYELKSTESGTRGAKEITYVSWVGTVSIRTPTWPLTPGFPTSLDRLIILPGMVGPGWGPLRFRLPEGIMGEEGWDDWPPRRRVARASDWREGIIEGDELTG